MSLSRASGILLHPTSLPGPFGVGDLGPGAYRFADFLAAPGQGLWQILPLGPTGYGNSPYMPFSAFGGNGLLISLELLQDDQLLDAADLEPAPDFPRDRVDFGAVIDYKMPLLGKPFQRFHARLAESPSHDFYGFCEQNASWLEDYALFASLKAVHDGVVWTDWESGARDRDPETLVRWRNHLAEAIQVQKFIQYEFFRQWSALRRYCHARGVRIIGDLPIYVAHDSAEVWANRDLFFLDAVGHPLVVAGVPPDYFSATGQRWGNPIYRWDVMARRGYHWWIERLRVNFSLADIVRLDHFRGFEAYWEIPAGAPTAIDGTWVKGPGAALFDAVRHALGDVEMIAEDLGVITPEVDELRDRLGYPGMRILQMAFGNDPKAPGYRPHRHIDNCAVYTATHDHNTTVGWFSAEPGTQTTQTWAEVEAERRYALRYVGTDGEEIHWDFVRLALASVARWAIVPLQDVLGLGTEARMNLPGTTQGNWEWRCHSEALTPEIRDRLAGLTSVYERDPR